MKPKSKGVTRLKEGLHYATVITLAISNLSVLAIAVLFSNSFLGGAMADIYLSGQKQQIIDGYIKTREAQAQSIIADPEPTQGNGSIDTPQVGVDVNSLCDETGGSRNSCYNRCPVCRGIEDRSTDALCNMRKNDCMENCNNNCSN